MKMKLFLSAVLLAGVISSQAASVNSPSATNTAATKPVPTTSTNSTEDAMKALFGDPVIVKGTGFQIKRSELDDVLAGAKANAAAQNQMLPPDFDMNVLNQLITIQLLLQKATPADAEAGKIEAEAQYKKLMERFATPEAFQRQLKAIGMSLENLQAKALQEATAKAALKRELSINITETEAKDYYTAHSADFEEPEKVHVRHILLMTMDPQTRTSLSSNTIAFKRKQIDDLLKRAKAGEDFAKLATQYSEDPGSKESGGELPEFPRGQTMPEFEAAAFSLSKGQVSDVVTTVFGYHIIKVLDKTPSKKIDYATAAADIKEGLARMQMAKLAPDYVKKLHTELKVEILDPALKAAEARLMAAQDAASAADGPANSLK